MNKAHRVVWSQVRNCFVVASEKTKAKGKPSTTRTAPSTPLRTGIAAAVAALFLTPGMAFAACTPPSPVTTALASQVVVCDDTNFTINSSGSITVTSSGSTSAVYVSATPYRSTLTNNGTISATANITSGWYSAYGIYVGSVNLTGSITNSGMINATANGISSASQVNAYGVYVNGTLGTLTNTGTISASANNNNSYATAYGVNVKGSFSGALTGSITNNGTIEASATAQSSAFAYGVNVGFGGITSTGRLENSGTISATANGAIGSAYGVYIGSSLSGILNNSGHISATVDAGTWASAYGVKVNALSGTLTNVGTINASATAQSSAYAYGVYVGFGGITSTGRLENSGTISATANGASGSAYGVYIGGNLGGILNNSGTIRATGLGTVSDANVYSIYANSGSGTINNLAGGVLEGRVVAGGTVSLVNDGTINTRLQQSSIGGNYTQGATGVLEIGAVNAGTHGSLSVGGTATLAAGTSIRVDADPAHTLVATNVLTNVISAGTLTCSTTSDCSTIKVQDSLLALNFVASDNGLNGVDLTAIDASANMTTIAAAVAASGSGATAGAAAVLDGMMGTINTQPKELRDFLYELGASATAQQVTDKVSQVLPLMAGGMGQVTFGNLRGVNRVVQARMEQSRGLSSGDDFAGNRKAWIKPLGSWADQKNSNGAFGYSAQTFGVAMGADSELSQASRLGAAFAYSHSNVDDNSGAQTAGINSYLLMLYGARSLDETTELNWQADYGYNQNKGNRRIGALTALSDYTSDSFHVGAGIGRTMAMSEQTSFTPSFRADYTTLHANGYSETGAGALNLIVGGKTAEELILAVDGKVARAVSDTSTVVANLGLGYDVNARQNSVTAAFSGGGAAFTTDGINPSPALVRGGVGYVSKTAGGMEITARYDIEARTGFTGQTASVKARWAF